MLDAGVIEKERNGKGAVAQIWPVDGGTIRIDTLWDPENPDMPRYYWAPEGYRDEAGLLNEDLVYIMLRPSTHRQVGLSSMEILKATIDADFASFDYNARQVSTAGGEGIFDLGENARPEQVERYKSYWFSEVAGRAAIGFWGGTKNAKWIPTSRSNREAQFMEWSVWLAKRTAAVFALHPQDLGITNDVNKAIGQVLDQQTEDRGARTQLSRLQDYLTREVVWDRGFGGRENNLAFRFTKLNLRATQAQAMIEKTQVAGMPTRSVDEIRVEKGLEPWGAPFDRPMIVTPTGAVTLIDVPSAAEALASRGRGEAGTPSGKAPQDQAAAAQSKAEQLAIDAVDPADFLDKLRAWEAVKRGGLMNVVILSAGEDTGGVGVAIKRAFDRWAPEWSVRYVRRADNYIHYPVDIHWAPNDAVVGQKIDALVRDAQVVHMMQKWTAAEGYPGYESKGKVIHHHGTIFRKDPGPHLERAKADRAISIVSTVDLLKPDPDHLQWLPEPGEPRPDARAPLEASLREQGPGDACADRPDRKGHGRLHRGHEPGGRQDRARHRRARELGAMPDPQGERGCPS